MFVQVMAAIGASIVTVGMIAGALGVAAKSKYVGRPLKWLWTKNVAEPIGAWHRHHTGEVVDDRIEHLMHHRNGGSSLLDLAESVKAVKKDVSLLLRHDAERDTAGHRYGPDENAPQPEEGTR